MNRIIIFIYFISFNHLFIVAQQSVRDERILVLPQFIETYNLYTPTYFQDSSQVNVQVGGVRLYNSIYPQATSAVGHGSILFRPRKVGNQLKNMRFGMSIIAERVSIFLKSRGYLSYSYKVNLDKRARYLSFGMTMGLFQFRIDENDSGIMRSNFRIDGHAGIRYQGTRLSLGFSLNHFIPGTAEVFKQRKALRRALQFDGKYITDLNTLWSMYLIGLISVTPDREVQHEEYRFGTMVFYQNKIGAGMNIEHEQLKTELLFLIKIKDFRLNDTSTFWDLSASYEVPIVFSKNDDNLGRSFNYFQLLLNFYLN